MILVAVWLMKYLSWDGRLFDLVVSCEGAKMVELEIRKGVFVRYADGMLTLDMGDEGYGRDQRSIELSELRDLRVLSDTTMVEIFANGGEAALTSRTYSPAVPASGLHAEGAASMDFYRLAHYPCMEHDWTCWSECVAVAAANYRLSRIATVCGISNTP